MNWQQLLEALRADLGGDFRFGSHAIAEQGSAGGEQGEGGDSAAEPVAGDPVKWHQVALEGEFGGHHQGAFKMGEQDFDQIRINFDRIKTDLVVDYEHNSLNMFAESAPAAGWIDAVQAKQSDQGLGLYARVRWNDRAAAHIRAREYRYLSPVLVFSTRDRKSGADLGTSLHSVALTNTPFLDELPEVRLNSIARRLSGSPARAPYRKPTLRRLAMDPEQMAALAVKLGLTPNATPEQILTLVEQREEDVSALSAVIKTLGLDEGASGDAISGAVAGLAESTKAQAERLDALERMQREQSVDRRMSEARRSGKVNASNEPWARKMASERPDFFDEWAASAPALVPVQAVEPRDTAAPPSMTAKFPRADDDDKAALSQMSDTDQAICSRLGIKPANFVRFNDPSFIAEHTDHGGSK